MKRAGGLALILLMAGMGFTFKGAWIYVKAIAAQELIAMAWEKTVSSGIAQKPWPWADTRPVARLNVPRLDVDLIALFGDSGRTLAFGPGLSTSNGSATVISGHRDTHFSFLGDVVIGDRILLTTAGRVEVAYKVVEMVVFNAEEEELVVDGNKAPLLLVTCWPLDAVIPGGPMRLAVIAYEAG